MLFPLHSSQIHYGAIYWLFVLQHSNEILALKINFWHCAKLCVRWQQFWRKATFWLSSDSYVNKAEKHQRAGWLCVAVAPPRRQSTSFMCSRLWLEMFRVWFPCRCVACAVSCCLLWKASFCGSCCHTVQLAVFTLLEQNPSLARTEKWQLGQEKNSRRENTVWESHQKALHAHQ